LWSSMVMPTLNYEWPLTTACGVVRERRGKPCFGWALPPREDRVWKGIRMGHVEITQGQANPRKQIL